MPCPCRSPAVLCRGLEKSLSEQHGRSTAGARHGHVMVCVNKTRHGTVTAWAGHALCELTVKADSHIACRAAKSLDCVFPIWFTQCGRAWFTLSMPCPCHAPTMLFFSRPRHSTSCRETAYGLPARVQLLPAITRSSTKVVIRSIPISDAGVHCETK